MNEVLAPPSHPELSTERVEAIRSHLVDQVVRSRSKPGRRRHLVIVIATGLSALALTAGGYATGVGPFDLFDHPGSPERIGSRVEIGARDEWSLNAWRSDRGICLGVTVDGRPFASGCGMPVIGAPPDTVFEQEPSTHKIGLMMASADASAFYVTGPLSHDVARVQVELPGDRVIDAEVFDAPAELDVPLRFYFLRVQESPVSASARVQAVMAYDSAGGLIERLTAPSSLWPPADE